MTTITFENKTYTLISDAEQTGRLLPYPKNYHEVESGEEYDFEMRANAEDEEGKRYEVLWIFSDIKGDEKELDCFDYDDIYDVREV